MLEWYEECVMLTFYKELTRRYHLTSAIWLHDGMWIPREVPVEIIRIAEQSMLHILDLDPTPVFKIRELGEELWELVSTLEISPHTRHGTAKLSNIAAGTSDHTDRPSRRIRWNTQASTTGYTTYVERVAKLRRRK